MHERFRGLWRHVDFRRLWAGTTISIFGTMIGGGALTYAAIIELDAHAWELAVLAGCGLVPGFAFGLFGGALVDRFHRRPIMIACDIGRFAILGTIPLAAWFDVLTIGQLWLCAFLATTLTDCLFNPSYEAYLPTIIDRDQLLEGNSKLTATANVAEFSGFSISGWLVQLLRAPGAIGIDALTYLASAFFIWRIRTPEPPPKSVHERRHIFREIHEGASYVAHSSLLRSIVAGDIFLAFGSRMVPVVYLLYLNEEVGFSPGVLGMIFAIGGISSLLASLLVQRILARRHFGAVMVVSLALIPIGMLGMPLASSVSIVGYTALIANQLITDPGWTIWDITKISLRQGVTPDHLQGRMNSTMRFIEFGSALAGVALAGVLGSTIGARDTLWVVVGVISLPAIIVLFSPVARLSRPPEPEPEAVLAS